MPTIPIYIRKEDYSKFLEMYSPEWMHEVLNGSEVVTSASSNVISKDVVPDSAPVVKSLADAIEEDEEPSWHKTWAIDRATNMVVDVEAQELIDGADKEIYNWLKKNDRYVG